MRFVNNIELSSILAQPRIYSSNRLGAMASWRDEGHFEMAKKVARKIWRQITPQCLEKSLQIDAKAYGGSSWGQQRSHQVLTNLNT